MMTNLCSKVLQTLKGKTLVTAESCTGGWIGTELTGITGSSEVYKGGVICYTDWVKHNVLGVNKTLLEQEGAVSASVAQELASGVRKLLDADIAVSVTGLAGPGADEFGNPVGTVYIGYSDARKQEVRQFLFSGDRDSVRSQSVTAALKLILDNN